MIFHVSPTTELSGHIYLPASKSYSIRAFIIAACGGRSQIISPSNCKDAIVARQIASALGAQVQEVKEGVWNVFVDSRASISPRINVQESGTGLRFLLPLACLKNEPCRIVGEGSLKGRPNHFLTETLRRMGASIEGRGQVESVPIVIKPQSMQGGTIAIDGSLSSQFISALLITCPMLGVDTRLKLVGRKIVSSDYITMTQQVLERAGVSVHKKEARLYQIKGNQVYKGLRRFHVPSDYGLAAFPMAAAVLTKSDVTLNGFFSDDLIQADGHIFPLLEALGVDFKKTSRSIKVKGPFVLKGGSFSLKDAPDLVPIMAILALFARRKTRLRNIKHARVKESDRISDLRKELLKVGARVDEKEDELIIHPLQEYKENVLIDPHNDHRLAMAFSVFGIKHAVRIKDIECTQKSYPDFVKDFKILHVDASLQRNDR
ncbi:MAG: 3-phosphoshikimate 1-carboxyvinyltransferase [Candidatus Omnitrophica bacterium]|nr:3-phosphoshikimate 1-carboxyvinyltransferase [Candidatus Omnitrophota bacterium]